MVDWNQFKIIQNKPEQHANNSRNEGSTKTAILSTAHILRTLLMWECRTYFTGEIILHVAQIVNTQYFQNYTL